jgi:hypothetical protein
VLSRWPADELGRIGHNSLLPADYVLTPPNIHYADSIAQNSELGSQVTRLSSCIWLVGQPSIASGFVTPLSLDPQFLEVGSAISQRLPWFPWNCE